MRRAIVPTAAIMVLATASPAAAADQVEGVWNFGQGQVAVDAQPDGSFVGTVIRETLFSVCNHQVGERMWVMRTQPDGSYIGTHQWLQNDCSPAPLGKAAWRILLKPTGERFLRLCTASPSSGLQPVIAPDGTVTNTDTACDDSSLISPPVKAKPTIATISDLPPARRCRSRRLFTIHLKEPKGDALKSATIYLNNKVVATRVGNRLTAPVNLRGLPKGIYRIKIVATTVRGKTITGSRSYRTCVQKAGKNKGPL